MTHKVTPAKGPPSRWGHNILGTVGLCVVLPFFVGRGTWRLTQKVEWTLLSTGLTGLGALGARLAACKLPKDPQTGRTLLSTPGFSYLIYPAVAAASSWLAYAKPWVTCAAGLTSAGLGALLNLSAKPIAKRPSGIVLPSTALLSLLVGNLERSVTQVLGYQDRDLRHLTCTDEELAQTNARVEELFTRATELESRIPDSEVALRLRLDQQLGRLDLFTLWSHQLPELRKNWRLSQQAARNAEITGAAETELLHRLEKKFWIRPTIGDGNCAGYAIAFASDPELIALEKKARAMEDPEEVRAAFAKRLATIQASLQDAIKMGKSADSHESQLNLLLGLHDPSHPMLSVLPWEQVKWALESEEGWEELRGSAVALWADLNERINKILSAHEEPISNWARGATNLILTVKMIRLRYQLACKISDEREKHSAILKREFEYFLRYPNNATTAFREALKRLNGLKDRVPSKAIDAFIGSISHWNSATTGVMWLVDELFPFIAELVHSDIHVYSIHSGEGERRFLCKEEGVPQIALFFSLTGKHYEPLIPLEAAPATRPADLSGA